jgi:hypothetical protein
MMLLDDAKTAIFMPLIVSGTGGYILLRPTSATNCGGWIEN